MRHPPAAWLLCGSSSPDDQASRVVIPQRHGDRLFYYYSFGRAPASLRPQTDVRTAPPRPTARLPADRRAPAQHDWPASARHLGAVQRSPSRAYVVHGRATPVPVPVMALPSRWARDLAAAAPTGSGAAGAAGRRGARAAACSRAATASVPAAQPGVLRVLLFCARGIRPSRLYAASRAGRRLWADLLASWPAGRALGGAPWPAPPLPLALPYSLNSGEAAYSPSTRVQHSHGYHAYWSPSSWSASTTRPHQLRTPTTASFWLDGYWRRASASFVLGVYSRSAPARVRRWPRAD